MMTDIIMKRKVGNIANISKENPILFRQEWVIRLRPQEKQ